MIENTGHGEHNPRLKHLADAIEEACGEDVPLWVRYDAARMVNAYVTGHRFPCKALLVPADFGDMEVGDDCSDPFGRPVADCHS